ncbi:MAG: hypothetical protein FJY85_14445, partial [Deltaproteobacteria bacterium]|nr:hypothetical protein [Deltaproteobacteria bacterium]
MKQESELFEAALVALLTLLALILVYADYSHRNPEWKAFQRKGVDLALERLDANLSAARDREDQERIRSEIQALATRDLQVVEVRPFGGKMAPERCLTCHFGIEDLSPSHPNSVFGCVICHEGNGPDLTVRGAHLGLRGGRNPARLDLAGVSCGTPASETGACHSHRPHPLLNRAESVPRSLMATNAGIISILRFQWGLDPEPTSLFGIRAVSDGKVSLKAVPPERTPEGTFSIADSHFRKFCAACHLWTPRHREKMGRLEGCPACHAPYDQGGRYRGGDPTVDR